MRQTDRKVNGGSIVFLVDTSTTGYITTTASEHVTTDHVTSPDHAITTDVSSVGAVTKSTTTQVEPTKKFFPHCQQRGDGPRFIDVGGVHPFWYTPNPICVKGRQIFAADVATKQLIPHRSGRFTTVHPLNDILLNATYSMTPVNHERPFLILNSCLSMYHVFTDTLLPMSGLLTENSSSRQLIFGDFSSGADVVFRSDCLVFHLSSLIFGLPFVTNDSITISGLSDRDLFTSLRNRVFVTLPPPEEYIRLEDSDYGSPERRLIVLRDDNISDNDSSSGSKMECRCSGLVGGESSAKKFNPKEFMEVVNEKIGIALPPSQLSKKLWDGCKPNDYRVLLVLRSHSRLLDHPKSIAAAVMELPMTCVRHYAFDEASLLTQYYLARTADVMIATHGAALTWIPFLRRIRKKSKKACCKAVIELWYFGKHTKELSVYERLSSVCGIFYQRLQPRSAKFFNLNRSMITESVLRDRHVMELSDEVSLPAGATLVTDVRENILRGAAMLKLKYPHNARDFLQQIASFDPIRVREAVRTALKCAQSCENTTDRSWDSSTTDPSTFNISDT